MTDKKKIISIEIIRTLACLAVFNQHILGAMARREDIILEKLVVALFELNRFAVPTFVFLFAFFMAKSKQCGYFKFLKNKFKQIYVPYIFISLIGMLYNLSNSKDSLSFLQFLKLFIKNVIFGNAFYHLWYVPMIFQFIIFAPIFFKLINYLKNCSKNKLIIFYLCFSSICFAYMIIMPQIITQNYTRIFTTWIFYFVTGILCGLYSDEFFKYIHKILPLAIIISIIGICFAINKDFNYIEQNGIINFGLVSFLEPMYAIFTIFEIFALIGISEKFKNINLIAYVSVFIGKHSYMIYLVHAICISYISLNMIIYYPNLDIIVFYLILYPLSLGLSIICAVILDNIKKIK